MKKTKNLLVSSGVLLGIGASAFVAPVANATTVSITPETSKTISAVHVATTNKVTYAKTGKTVANLNLRASNNTNSKIIKVLKKGAPVTILKTSNGWHQVKTGNSKGWVSAKYITGHKTTKVSTPKKTTTVKKKTANTAQKQTSVNLNLRSAGTSKGRVIAVLKAGTKVTVKSTSNGWAQVSYAGKTGWVSAKYLTGISTKPTTAKKSNNMNAVRGKIINNAKKYVGTQYRWGGTSPRTGWDCSGYIQYVFKESGIKTARTKAWIGKKRVSKAQAKPGDLVVQYGGGHVGIYAGYGKQYHASNPVTDTVYSNVWDKKATYYSIG